MQGALADSGVAFPSRCILDNLGAGSEAVNDLVDAMDDLGQAAVEEVERHLAAVEEVERHLRAGAWETEATRSTGRPGCNRSWSRASPA